MEDREIIELYNARSESAITHTAEKYGNYCHTIAFNILQNEEDADECVNDTYFRVWNLIPPQWPDNFRMFIGRITRNLSFDIFKYYHAEKRLGNQTAIILDELSECIPSKEKTEDLVDKIILVDILNRFLSNLPKREQWIFTRRYWNTDSVKDIADTLGLTEGNVKIILHRTRKKLLSELEKEGFNYAPG